MSKLNESILIAVSLLIVWTVHINFTGYFSLFDVTPALWKLAYSLACGFVMGRLAVKLAK